MKNISMQYPNGHSSATVTPAEAPITADTKLSKEESVANPENPKKMTC